MASMMMKTDFLNTLSRTDGFGSTYLGIGVSSSGIGILKYRACLSELRGSLRLLFGGGDSRKGPQTETF